MVLTNLNLNTRIELKTSDQTVNNSTTLVNDTELVIPLSANTTYIITGCLMVDGFIASDIRLTFADFTGGSNKQFFAGSTRGDRVNFGTASVVTLVSDGAILVQMASGVTTPDNGVTLQLQFAQGTAVAQDTSILAGSWLEARAI